MLPSEKELAKQFGVSLVTVRAAMRSLTDQGLVDRRPGKGTIVLGRQDRAVWELGWLNDLIASVLPQRLEIVAMRSAPAPAWVAERFGLAHGARVHYMDTVRYVKGTEDEPFLTTKIYHPRELGALVRRSDFQSEQAQAQWVIGIVEAKCKLRVTNVRQTMSTRLADSITSSRLKLAVGEPLLEVTRDYFDATGRLVQTGRSLYRTDRHQYVLNLSRSGPAGRYSFSQFEGLNTNSSTTT